VEVAIFTTLLEIVLKTFGEEDKFNRRGRDSKVWFHSKFHRYSAIYVPSILILKIAGLPF